MSSQWSSINLPKGEYMRYQLLIILLLGISLVPAGAGASVADISGTWACSIEYANGTRSNGPLVLKQERENLTGVLSGQYGGYQLRGTVKSDKVVFSFDITLRDHIQPTKITFTGSIQSTAKMSGAAEYPKGTVNWAATRKE